VEIVNTNKLCIVMLLSVILIIACLVCLVRFYRSKKNKSIYKEKGLWIAALVVLTIMINPLFHVVVGGVFFHGKIENTLGKLEKLTHSEAYLDKVLEMLGSPSATEIQDVDNTMFLKYYEHPPFLFSFSEVIVEIKNGKLVTYWLVSVF
jgi:hypothetical protein